MSQPDTAANNNLRNGMIFMLLLTLVAVVCYFSFSREGEEETKHPTNPTTAAIRKDKETEAGKKGSKIETSGKATAVQGEASTSYISIWSVLGASLVTTLALAYYREQNVVCLSSSSRLIKIYCHVFSNEIVVILFDLFLAWVTLTVSMWLMKIEDNMLVGICSGQNLVKNLGTISCSLLCTGTIYGLTNSIGGRTTPYVLGKTLITVILTWMVHDIIAYQLSKKASKPSIKPTPKIA